MVVEPTRIRDKMSKKNPIKISWESYSYWELAGVTIEAANDENHVVQNDGGEIAARAEHLRNRVPILRMIRIVTFPCGSIS